VGYDIILQRGSSCKKNVKQSGEISRKTKNGTKGDLRRRGKRKYQRDPGENVRRSPETQDRKKEGFNRIDEEEEKLESVHSTGGVAENMSTVRGGSQVFVGKPEKTCVGVRGDKGGPGGARGREGKYERRRAYVRSKSQDGKWRGKKQEGVGGP